jgi:hypothetical protein
MTRCWLARVLELEDDCQYREDGRPDAAHIGLSEHFLAKAPNGPHLTQEQANDGRLLYDCCRLHHWRYDAGLVNLERRHIPQSVEDFAEEHGLTWRLDRDYGKAGE